MDLKTQQFLPAHCDHTKIETWLRMLTNMQKEARTRPVACGSDEEV